MDVKLPGGLAISTVICLAAGVALYALLEVKFPTVRKIVRGA